MSDRITQSNEDAAFARLAKAMGWDVSIKPYINGKPLVGAIYLAHSNHGGAIEEITTEGGGVRALLNSHTWRSRRQSYETMMAMALAVEEFKQAA